MAHPAGALGQRRSTQLGGRVATIAGVSPNRANQAAKAGWAVRQTPGEDPDDHNNNSGDDVSRDVEDTSFSSATSQGQTTVSNINLTITKGNFDIENIEIINK